MPRTKETRNPLGSIFKKSITKNGKKISVWDARKRYQVGETEDGKPIYKDKTRRCYSYQDAVTTLANFPVELEEEKQKKIKKEKLKHEHGFFELCEYFDKEFCKPAVFVDDRQVAGYRQNFKNIQTYLQEYKEYFGDIPLESITYEHFRTYAESIATSPVKKENATRLPKAATVNRKLAYLRRLLNVAIQKQWLKVNPFKLGKTLISTKSETSRERILTFAEEQKFLEVCDRTKETLPYVWKEKTYEATYPVDRRALKLFFIMAIDTGMRKKEILLLERKQILLEKNIIILPAPITKAFKQRIIPISERLKNQFKIFFASFTIEPDQLIFGGAQDIKKAFHTACSRAGIKDLRIHDLRHTATSWLDEAGISEAVKMNVVGHSSSGVHQRYNNLSDDIINSTKVKMDQLRQRMEEKAKNEKV